MFHDDQHGTAVVALAALENALQDRRQGDGRHAASSSPASAPPGVGDAARSCMDAGRAATSSASTATGAIYDGPRRPQRRQGSGSPSTPTPSSLSGSLSDVHAPAPTCSSG
ncbi:MAG: hypothetical protein V9E94_04745 [Microthrixaceae bacterium]